MKYPKFNVYDFHTPMVQWIDDRAAVDIPMWRSYDDEFTERKYFPSLIEAILYVQKQLRVHHYLVHDGHAWNEIFLRAA